MKKIIIMVILSFALTSAQAKNFMQQLQHIIGSKPEVNINIGSWLFNTALNFSDNDDAQEARELLKNLDKITITVFDLAHNSQQSKLSSAIKAKIKHLKATGYETLLTAREQHDQITILAKVSGKTLQDAMIIALEEQDELVVISLHGEIGKNHLVKLTEQFDIDLTDIIDS